MRTAVTRWIATMPRALTTWFRRRHGRTGRKQRDQARERRHLAAVFRSIGDGVIVCDSQGRVTSMNPVAERLCGWTASEAAGRPLEEVFRIVNAATLEPAPNPVPKALAEGQATGLANDTLPINRTGERIPIADSCAPIFAGGARPVGAVLVFRDVSELYRAQQKLAESEQRYRLLAENALAGIGMHEILRDQQGRAIDTVVRHVNSRFGVESGIDPAQILGRRLSQWLATDEAKRWLERLDAVDRSGEPMVVEEEVSTTGRRYLLQAWRVEPGLVGVAFVDVSHIREAEQRAARLGRILEASSNEVYVFDAETLRFVEASPSALESLGYSMEELRELTPLDIKPEFSRAQFEAMLAPLREGRQLWIRFQTLHRRKDGSDYPVRVRLEMLEEGPRRLFLAVIEDLAELTEAERKWVQEHDRLAAVVGSARDAIVLLDENRRIRLWNPAAEALFGIASQDAEGQCLGRLIGIEPATTDQSADVREMLQWLRCEKSGLPQARLATCRANTSQGGQLAIELSIAPTMIAGVPHYVAVLRDVSEPLRLREELASSEQWHRALFEHAAIPLATVDSQTLAIRQMNGALRQWLSVDGHGPQGISLLELAGGGDDDSRNDKEQLQDAISRARREGRASVEFQLRRPDGTKPWSLTTIAVVKDGSSPQLLVSFQDLPPQKEAHQKLAESEGRYRAIVEHAADLVWTVSRSGEITYASPSWRRVAGYSPEELVGQSFRLGIHPDDLGSAEQALDDLFSGRAMERGLVYRVRHADGAWRWHEGEAMAVCDDRGMVVSVVGVSRDITQRKRAEEALQRNLRALEQARQSEQAKADALAEAIRQLDEARSRAEQASRAKSDFLARMSHEMRTPLNAITGMALLLKDQVEGQQAEQVEAILSSSRNLLQLIDELLAMSAIEAGRLELIEAPFATAQLLEDVVRELGLVAAQKNLELLCKIEPGTPAALIGDERRLRQILLNLASNAVKYTSQGWVAISLGWTDGERTSLPERGGTLQMTVEDTGPGIPAEKIPLVFEKFSQLDESRSREAGGVGLGLAIVRQIVDRMGGEVSVESIVGRGTVFRVSIPLKRTANEGLFAPEVDRDWKIWVVSGRSVRREAAASLLRWLGADVREIDSLAELVRQLRPMQPTRAALLLWEDEYSGADIRSFGHIVANLTGLHPRFLMASSSASAPQTGSEVTAVGTPLRISELRRALVQAGIAGSAAPASSARIEPGAPDLTTGKTETGDEKVARPRVLVAEDNLLNQRVAAGLLSKLGLDCDLVSNGRQAIEALQGKHYDLALLDISMPEMDGMETARWIRNQSDQGVMRRLPLVALTAHVLPEERERCREAGFDDFLPKPISLAETAEVLARWVPGWKPARPVNQQTGSR